MRFVAHQAGFFVLRAQGPRLGLTLGLPRGLAPQLMGWGRQHGSRVRRGRRLRLASNCHGWCEGLQGLFFAQAVERGVRFDRRRIDGLSLAGY
jgi:hypothetical protein